MMKANFEIAPADEEEEYWDGDFQDDDDDESDEEAFDGTPVGLSISNNGNGHHGGHRLPGTLGMQQNSNGHPTGKKKQMKKMKVKTEQQYSIDRNAIVNLLLYNPKCRGVTCMGSICILLVVLAVKLIIPESSSSSSGGSAAAAAAALEDEEEIPRCYVHTTNEPFSEWTHHIRHTNGTELCRSEIEPENCRCHNPFTEGYDDDDEWKKVFDLNLHALNETIVATTTKDGGGGGLDLVLYGDSIIERMNGRVFGKPLDEIQDSLAVTKEIFTKEGGGQIEALPLGIAGEEIHTLMYRLKNGEMPNELKPGAWWLMIGTNDVVKAGCDIDAVVAGIAAVAEEIIRRDEINRQFDASHVVINSLFPRLLLYDDPLYNTIQEINSRLKCYAETTKGMEFFNSTTLFVNVDQTTGEAKVNSNLFLSDGIHLTAAGNRIWEEAIVEKAKYLIAHNT